ncbi:hypothetical protein RUR49_06805 [Pseudoxanthobacter sp. M-2]|uniref:hypothetical protein n=1 Tax=Pseudoxanthobacter sp. M-2 TaxID=3078754 RepID=UPI0038FCC931
MDFLAEQDRRRTLAAIRDKADRGDRLTTRERAELASEHARRVGDEIAAKLRAGKTTDAFRVLIAEMAATAILQAEKRVELEERIAALEAAAAPLKAGRLRMVAHGPRAVS